MKVVEIIELENYSAQKLKKLFDCEENDLQKYLKRLIKSNIVKKKRKSDNEEQDILLFDNGNIDDPDIIYYFDFVGIVVVNNIVIYCYPKYFDKDSCNIDSLKKILKVIQKARAKDNRHLNLQNFNNGEYSYLSVLIFLLDDYYENGLYENRISVREINGNGEILWERTVNNTPPVFSNGRPFYPNLITRKRTKNKEDYFRLLHSAIITEASSILKRLKLLEIFDVEPVDISNQSIEDFGDQDDIIYQLEQELNKQFNTRKRVVLQYMIEFIKKESKRMMDNQVLLYGTGKFKNIWEDVCKECFSNKLYTKIKKLGLPECADDDNSEKTLASLIEYPHWSYTGKDAEYTFKLDVVSIEKINSDSGEMAFVILDAKYYNPKLEKNVTPANQPGVEDITKEYVYQMLFSDFIKKYHLKIANCFLLPTVEKSVIKKGVASLNIFKNLDLEDIQVIFLPTDQIFDNYLQNKKNSIADLKIFS